MRVVEHRPRWRDRPWQWLPSIPTPSLDAFDSHFATYTVEEIRQLQSGQRSDPTLDDLWNSGSARARLYTALRDAGAADGWHQLRRRGGAG